MTAVHTPGSPGTTRRGKLAAMLGGITAALLILGCVFLIPNLGSADSGKLNCENADDIAVDLQAEASHPTKDFPDTTAGAREKKLYVEDHEARAQDAINFIMNHCGGDEDDAPGPGDTPTTTPPSGDACKGVTFSPYLTDGQRFGPPPVDLVNPGSPQDVANAFNRQLSKPEGRWLAAAWSQGSYLVDGGIGTGEVHAKAQSFVTDREAWRATNAKLRAILGRSTFELRRSAEPYKTQEAIVTGTNQCVAPAAKDVGLEARGERLLLIIHMAAIDGGRTITVVVDCDGQIHITETAPPAPVTPQPTQPHTTSPAPTPTTRPYVPPTPTTRPYIPPTTAPPPPTTAPPTTAPPPGKGPQENPCTQYPTMPGC